MASEIRVDKITSLSGVGTITPSSSGIDITGITTVATLKATTGIVTTLTATTGIVTTLTANTVTSLGAVSGTTGTFTGDVDIADTIVHTGDTNTKIRFPAADTVTVETGGSERARITSAGLVGIATATPRAQFDVIKATGNVIALFEGSNAAQNHRVRIDASAASSTTGLSISNSNSNNQSSLYHSGGNNNLVVMGGQTAGAEPTAGTTIATFASGGDVAVNTGDLYFGTAGKGIVLGATSNTDANTLDDYEEGTWTPNIRNDGATATWTTQQGRYVKIGEQVTVWFNADGGSTPRSGGGSGALIMTGLPYSQSIFGNPILGIIGANDNASSGLYSTAGIILNIFGQSGTQVRFGVGGQSANFGINYVAGCFTYTHS